MIDATLLVVIAVVVFLALMLSGMHIAVALMSVSIVGLLVLYSRLAVVVSIVGSVTFATVSQYSLVLIPLFILMGSFAGSSGVLKGAMQCLYTWIGWIRGGLALTTSATCGVFAAACGSGAATTAAIGKFMIPEMKRYGYDDMLATGVVAASGTIGILIPPSIVLVVYGIVVEESIGRLFMAGMLPGILSVGIYMVGILLVVRRWPHLAPETVTSSSWRDRIRALPGMWGITLLAFIVLGGIYGGVFTPTEAGAVGVFASFVLLAWHVRSAKELWRHFVGSVQDALKTTAMVFALIVAAQLFSRLFIYAGVFDWILGAVAEGGWPPGLIIVAVIGVSTIMGCFMHSMAVLLLVAPTAYSALVVGLGYDGIWLGIIMIKLFELAAITPPVGMTVYVTKGIAPYVPIARIFRGCGLFVVLDLLTIAVLVVFPQITLWLPSVLAP